MAAVQRRIPTTFEKRAREIIEIAESHGHDSLLAMEIAVAQVKLERAHYNSIVATVESRTHKVFFWNQLDMVRRHMNTVPPAEQLAGAEGPVRELNYKQDALPYDLRAMVVKRKASWNTAEYAREEIEQIRRKGKYHDTIPVPDDAHTIKPSTALATLYMDEVEARKQAAQLRQQIKNRGVKLSRRSLTLRRQQLQQLSAQKRQLEQRADEQPAEKRAHQDNASPVVQYDGPDVECEVSLEQDPVAVDPTAIETQQVDAFPLKIKTFSGFFF